MFTVFLLSFISIALSMNLPAVRYIDETVLAFFSGERVHFLNSFFVMVTDLGSIKLLFPLTILVSLIFLVRKRYMYILFLLAILWGARGTNEWIKSIVERPRPDLDPLINVGGFSFPSGHAMNSAAVYGFLIYLIWKENNQKRYLWTFILASVVITVSISRMYLGVHYLTDVFAGLAGGVALLFLAGYLTQNGQRLITKRKGGRDNRTDRTDSGNSSPL